MKDDGDNEQTLTSIGGSWNSAYGHWEFRLSNRPIKTLEPDEANELAARIQTEKAKAVLAARIEEREHTWKLINDIRYQHVSLDFAKEVSLERMTNAQVEQQLEAEAALKQGPTNAK